MAGDSSADEPIEIRILGADDAAAFRAIRLEALATAPEVYGTTLDQEAEQPDSFWYQRLVDPAKTTFVAFAGAGPVALACLRSGVAGNVRHRGFIWGVYAAPAWRGRGLGTDIMRALIDHADGQPAMEMTELNVRGDNDAARRLYARLGFRVTGTIPRALKHAGSYGDELVMVRFRHGAWP